MLKLERQLFVKSCERAVYLISELNKVLVTPEYRQDIRNRSGQKLNKIHGGAYLPDRYDKGVPIELRESFFASEKEQMADKAVDVRIILSTMLDFSTTYEACRGNHLIRKIILH